MYLSFIVGVITGVIVATLWKFIKHAEFGGKKVFIVSRSIKEKTTVQEVFKFEKEAKEFVEKLDKDNDVEYNYEEWEVRNK